MYRYTLLKIIDSHTSNPPNDLLELWMANNGLMLAPMISTLSLVPLKIIFRLAPMALGDHSHPSHHFFDHASDC